MTDLAELTVDDFTPHAGSRWTLRAAGIAEAIPLDLVEIAAGGQALRRGRRAFSLIFRGPRGPSLPQGLYHLEHPVMGQLEIFLVPITPEPDGARYEAVFT